MNKITKSSKPVSHVEHAHHKDGSRKNFILGLLPKYGSLLVFVLLFLVAVFIFNKNSSNKNDFTSLKETVIPALVKKIVAPDTEVSIGNIKEANGVYEFELSIGPKDKAQKYTSYITKDAKILFTSGLKVEDLNKQQAQQPTTATKKLTCEDMPKVDAPKLTAYVVSKCPYGLQMQRVFNKAITEQPALQPFLDVKYIGSVTDGKITSMHGDEEAQENLRQICIREEQVNKYWPYVGCYMKAGKSDECLVSSAVNKAQVTACMADKNRGLAFAQKDFDLQGKYNIGSSPTMLLDESQIISESDFGGRIANAVKDIVCCNSKNKPAFCGKDLSKDALAASFSTTDVATNQGGTAASGCGQ